MTEPSIRLVVVVACGWIREPNDKNDFWALCPTVIQRLEEALREIKREDIVGVTGDVPYDAAANSEATLASCMRAWLRAKGLHNKIVTVEGLNAFSESMLAVRAAKELGVNKISLFSSDFYLKAYDRMWRAWAERNGIKINIRTVRSGRWVTNEVHDFYGKPFGQAMLLSRFASLATPFGHFARYLADSKTKDRKTTGFQKTGCTEIV